MLAKKSPQREIIENARNLGVSFPLTSAGHPPYDGSRPMETTNAEPKGRRDMRKAAYPLRFKNKTQKERLERAARRMRMSLRDFLLSHAEQAATSILDNGVDLRAS